MPTNDNEKFRKFAVAGGGLARTPRRRAELEAERALRAALVAMRDQKGRAVGRTFEDVARGKTTPWRVLFRRFREAKQVRNDAHNYVKSIEAVRAAEQFVEALYADSPVTTDRNRSA